MRGVGGGGARQRRSAQLRRMRHFPASLFPLAGLIMLLRVLLLLLLLRAAQRRGRNRRDELVGSADWRRGELARGAGAYVAAEGIADDQVEQVAAVVRLLHRIKVTLNLVRQGRRIRSGRRHRRNALTVKRDRELGIKTNMNKYISSICHRQSAMKRSLLKSMPKRLVQRYTLRTVHCYYKQGCR